MGICKPRYFILTVCLLQLLSVIERQIFDFFGFLWIPILINFFEIIFVIFGFFGAFQRRPKYIIWYSLWNLIWLGWNIFLICLYLDIGTLHHKESKVLKLDPDSGSWWQNGPGCKGVLNTTAPVPTWENVTNCLVDYRHVEIFQAGLQCFLAVLGISISICLIKVFLEEDDDSLRKTPQTNSKRRSLYSIEFSQQLERQQRDDSSEYDHEQFAAPVSPKPMTPRRVKRRSVMTRGSSSRQSSSSRRYSTARSSTRSSHRIAQNPVTQLLEQQQRVQAHGDHSGQSIIDPLPSYCNSTSNNNMLHQSWHSNGHSNPTYQQSSMQSLNEPDDVDDLYNNRPASVRSSYSNFHGTRAMSHRSSQHFNNHATPQVPQKRANNPNRQSMRNMIFLNSGPPAYSSQGQTVIDSETTI
ncbi:hypothetical protein ILUMI_22153 [Ignelater luminosus]|uniref:Sodium/potassium-transporting ATPase subunit beta-1-interacting protein n=1 Tax=Ignelater luminosus TaxID=2038154 RepID=A0A8K0CHN5_IGNLU|nr:hypothetical protein ILUMI_22153 [Ignelater luminosus]